MRDTLKAARFVMVKTLDCVYENIQNVCLLNMYTRVRVLSRVVNCKLLTGGAQDL